MRDPKYIIVRIPYDRIALVADGLNDDPGNYYSVWINRNLLNMHIHERHVDQKANIVRIPVERNPLSQIHNIVGSLDNKTLVRFRRQDIVKTTLSEYLQLPEAFDVHPMLVESLMMMLFHDFVSFTAQMIGY